MLKDIRGCKSETVNTKIMLKSSSYDISLYQNIDFKTILAINNDLLTLFDYMKCDTDNGETIPNMQPYTNNNNSMFYWVNDACKLIILPVDLRANKQFTVIVKTMMETDFEEVNG